MKCLKKTFLVAFCLLPLSSSLGQTTRRRPVSPPAAKAPVAVATPSPEPTPVAVSAPPTLFGPLAIVNGQIISQGDLEPEVAQEMSKLGQKIAEARLQILGMQINTVLLDLEARRRKLTPQQVYDLEVTKRIVDPTDAEIKQFVEANKNQITETDPQNLKLQMTAYLHALAEEKLSADFVRRLRTTFPVVPGQDINSPNLSASAVVATIGGQPLTAGLVNDKMKSIVYKIQLDTYDLASAALNRTIDDLLLLAEANKRSVGPEEIIRTEITEKLRPPTDAAIAKFYNENKARIPGELASVSNQIASYLQQQEQARLEQALSERLRKGAQIKMLLAEPVQPTQAISVDGAASRGDVNARVTVVEFTDFECPACAAMQPVLEEVLKTFGNKVRFVVRNYPLDKHPHARKAAEAAAAAHAQGKFFEYSSLLFKRQNALDPASLKKYATELGLDRVRFDAELDSSKYAAVVRRDLDDGATYGIAATPTIFINGVMLKELTAAALNTAIERAMTSATPK